MTADLDLSGLPRRRALALLLAPLVLPQVACSPRPAGRRLAQADADLALKVLDRAPEHGFPSGAFQVREIHAAVARKDPQASALLRAGVIASARAQHGLTLPAKARPAAWGEGPPPYDAAAELDAALANRNVPQWLAALPPPDPLYAQLQGAYAASLAQPPSPFQATLRANLERLRWLPRQAPAPTRVDVNIASATLIYLVDGQPQLTMRTACGKPGDETPTLTSQIDDIVLNPPWNVPAGIANDELLPKGEDYLASHGFTTRDDGGLMQQPGPDSALGLVKFDFPNPYAVYLHDTPSKGAFDRSQRAVSHGCVRLERAMDLANLILGREAGWSPQRVADVVAAGQTTTVKLRSPVPVRLLYLTAVPQGTSQGQTLVPVPDLYGWDAELLQRLDRAA